MRCLKPDSNAINVGLSHKVVAWLGIKNMRQNSLCEGNISVNFTKTD